MTKNEKDNLLEWFKKADHDLIAARSLLENRPDVLDTVCFHCQQAVEKYLKAYLIFKGVDIPKTHYLKYLKTESAAFDADFSTLDFKNLNYYAIDVRYPDDAAEPSLSEALYYLETAESVKDLVLDKTGSLSE
jgi:HEPN domain-containing protein